MFFLLPSNPDDERRLEILGWVILLDVWHQEQMDLELSSRLTTDELKNLAGLVYHNNPKILELKYHILYRN